MYFGAQKIYSKCVLKVYSPYIVARPLISYSNIVLE